MITMWGLFRAGPQVDDLVAALQRQALPPGSINALVPERVAQELARPGGPAGRGGAAMRPGLATLLAGSHARPVAGAGALVAAGPVGRALARAATGRDLEQAFLAAGLSPGYAGFYLQGLRGSALLLAVTVADAQERELVNLYRRAGVEFLAGQPAAETGAAEAPPAGARRSQGTTEAPDAAPRAKAGAGPASGDSTRLRPLPQATQHHRRGRPHGTPGQAQSGTPEAGRRRGPGRAPESRPGATAGSPSDRAGHAGREPGEGAAMPAKSGPARRRRPRQGGS